MSFVFRGTRADIEPGFSGLIPERRAVIQRVHAARSVNSNSLAFLVTVLLLFMILNSHQMSPNFLLWLVLGVFFMATTLRMYATCQQLQAQAQAHAEEINALPVHKYKVSGPQSAGSSAHPTSSSGSTEKQEPANAVGGTKSSEDELTCSVCLEQVNDGELIRSLPCLHQFHANCIDPWLRQRGTCPVCKFRARSRWDENGRGEDAYDMV